MSDVRQQLFEKGSALVARWCDANGMSTPKIIVSPNERCFGTCAYYRNGTIKIWVELCARPGTAGRQWSWPGYSVDRTPYGVLCHELGHHADHGLSYGIRREADEKPLTSYAPNDAEWFAEMFRLFVTNPTLLKGLRPRTFRELHKRWVTVEHRSWRSVLKGAERQLAVTARRLS